MRVLNPEKKRFVPLAAPCLVDSLITRGQYAPMSRSPDVLFMKVTGREEINVMEGVHPVCGGIDGHAAQLTACLRRVGEEGTMDTEWRDCGTT